MPRKTKRPPVIPEHLETALRAFQEHYGDDWPATLTLYHLGRPAAAPGGGVEDYISPMRQIRNWYTPNPTELPDLRKDGRR